MAAGRGGLAARSRVSALLIVMTELGPVIHGSASKPLVNCRIKSGHDEDRWAKEHLSQRQA
jgi:hypothetical protein